MKNGRNIKRRTARSLVALVVISIFILSIFGGNVRSIVDTAVATVSGMAAQSVGMLHRNAFQNSGPSTLFKCSDGRIGMHIVHTRFLVGQSKSSRLFIATRLALLRTFLMPSLNAQSSQNFVMYISYDPDLPPSAINSLKDAALTLKAARIVLYPEHVPADGDWSALNFTRGVGAAQIASGALDLLITSRIDADDAAHYNAIEAIQQYACSAGMHADTSGKEAVRLVYLQNGQIWFPSATSEYGMSGIWKKGKDVDDLYRVLAIMQSMVLSGKSFVQNCAQKFNVYGLRHYQPEDLETRKIDGCKFRFSARKNVLYWEPPEGEFGYLYVRTVSSWTRNKADLKYKKAEVDITAMQTSFGITPAVLAATNIMFAGFERESSKLVTAKGAVGIE